MRLHRRRRCRRGERVGRDARTRLHLRLRPIAGCSHRTCAMSTPSSPPFTKRYGNLVGVIDTVPGALVPTPQGGGPCYIAVNFRDSTVDGLVYLNLLRR